MTDVALAVELAATRPLTDAGNAEVFVAMHHDLVRYDHGRDRWLVWDSHRWRPDRNETVRRLALSAARARYHAAGDDALDHEARKRLAKHALSSESAPRIGALLSLARSMTPIADEGTGWDAKRGLLGAPNGVIDLRTGELRDGRPEDAITMQVGCDYDPTATAPRWEAFLHEVFGGDPDLIRYVQRAAGYALTGEATLDMLLILMGSGSNGKSTFLTMLRAIGGDYAREVSALAFKASRHDSHPTEVAEFELGRLVTCEEIGDTRLNANRLKQLSGGGSVNARRMRQDPRTFDVTWQLWLTTNGLPRADDNSWAFWRRVHIIPFRQRFDRLSEPDLEDKLRAELSGILAWAVRGAVAFYESGNLGDVPAAVSEATQDYREDTDPLEALFEQGVLVADPTVQTATSALYGAYLGWANTNQVPLDRRFGEQGFARALSGRFDRSRYKDENDKKVRSFVGVRIVAGN